MNQYGLQLMSIGNNLMIDSHFSNVSLTIATRKNAMNVIGNTPYERPEYGRALSVSNYRTFPVEPMVHYRIEVPIKIKAPILVIDAFDDYIFCGGIHKEGNKRYASIYTNNPNDFGVYIFSANNRNTSNFGLEIYDGHGNTVFDSSHSYLHIINSLDAHKKCGVILRGAIVLEHVIFQLAGYQHKLLSFRIVNNEIKRINVWHYAYVRTRRYDGHVGKVSLDSMPMIVNLSNIHV